jgi:hypothetical protein
MRTAWRKYLGANRLKSTEKKRSGEKKAVVKNLRRESSRKIKQKKISMAETHVLGYGQRTEGVYGK